MPRSGTSNGVVSPLASPWYARHWRWLAVGMMLLMVAVCLSLVSPVWLAGQDAVKYADSARSLACGDGYLFNGGRESKHPPGFPALLALLFPLTSDPLLGGRIMTVLTAGVALYLAGTILRRELGPGVSLAALGCVGISVHLLWSTQWVLSEYPYAVFQNLALVLLLKSFCSGRLRRREALLFGLATGAAMLIRPIGLALIVTWVYSMVRRRLAGLVTTSRAAVLSAFGVGIPVVAFGLWRVYTAFYVGAGVPENLSILMRGYGGADTTPIWSMVARTVKNMLSEGGGLFFGDVFPEQYPSVAPILWVVLVLVWLPVPVALVVRGVWRAQPLWIFLCVYLATIALWPLASGATARLCWPVAPFIAGLLLWSYRWLIGVVWPRRGPMVVSAAILVAVLLGQVTLGGRLRQGLRDDELFWARRLDDLSSIRNQFHPAPPAVWAQLNVREAVYVFDMPTTVMEFTWSKDPARWAWELDAYQPDYIVVPTTPLQRENTERFVELLRQVRPTAKCVVELETVSLYRIPQDDARTRP